MRHFASDGPRLSEPLLVDGRSWRSRVPKRAALRVLIDLAIEVAIVYSFLKGYNLVRNKFGSKAASPHRALAHARQVRRAGPSPDPSSARFRATAEC